MKFLNFHWRETPANWWPLISILIMALPVFVGAKYTIVVEVEMISPVRWDGSLSAGISPALEVNQIFFLVIFGILRFIYFWRCVFSWIAVKFERVLAFHKLEGMSNFLLDDIFYRLGGLSNFFLDDIWYIIIQFSLTVLVFLNCS